MRRCCIQFEEHNSIVSDVMIGEVIYSEKYVADALALAGTLAD